MTRQPLRILHYLPRIRLEEGGVVRAVLDLCGLLAGAGHRVDILTHDDADAPAAWGREPRTPTLRRLAPPGPLTSLLPIGRWREAEPLVDDADVVHLHTPWETGNLALARAARNAGKPYVLTIHGMLDDWSMAQRTLKKRLYLALFGRRLLENAAAVHCTAQAEQTQSTKWFPRGRPVVAPLVFDLEPFRDLPGPDQARAELGLEPDGPLVLFLSRLHYKKGLEVLIDAMAEPRLREADAAAVIAGPGEPEYIASLERRIAERALEGAVRLVGPVGGALKVSLYEAADVFALPTSQENFGFVLPEALACGTPAVTTQGVDIWPELEESGGAMIVERTPGAFAHAIADLLSDERRRSGMGERGRAWTLAQFHPDRVLGAFETMYREATG